eukprot:gnl/Spiro4/10718_TR5709_c0_g1_i1.p1 gnl/Spiro4/10718_TR5709_c0_g1~~gnl/Spiro4/10718_TR5709_c0_g1_i1.p1  ORF type:complete len:313 (+),score=-48.84 gnl/Spiro4/10718_TR5709_c0_g1_i1:115-1053(+)
MLKRLLWRARRLVSDEMLGLIYHLRTEPATKFGGYMKGFGIEVKNTLLDPKHVENMGPTVWLYMWFLDKITAVNDNGVGKVLGGQPVTYAMIEPSLGISRRTYVEWVRILLEAKYINTLRAPTGLVVTVNKAHKEFKRKGDARKSAHLIKKQASDAQDIAHRTNTDAQNNVRDAQFSAHPNKTIIPNGIITKTVIPNGITKEVTNVTSVQAPVFDDGTPDPRNQQVQQVIEHFEKRIGKMPRMTNQRRAAMTLIQRHTFQKTIGAINAIAVSRGMQFAPNITTLEALRDKWLDFENFIARQTAKKSRVRVIS